MAETTAQLALSVQETQGIFYEDALLEVARHLARRFWKSQKLHYKPVSALMQQAFGGSDAEGKWVWKDAYEAQEAAFVFMVPYLVEKGLKELNAIQVLRQLAFLESLGLTHTRRSDEAVALQQFSTPLQLAYIASHCARIQPGEMILEPSAGTGILAQWCRIRGAKLVLNELSDRRYRILHKLFPEQSIFTFNAEQIHDRLPEAIQPSVVIMNPPFSATPKVDKRNPQATGKHVRSAFLRLASGGRLVLISGHWFAPGSQFWHEAFHGLEGVVYPRLTVHLAGEIYAKHGTSIKTRLTVIDKVPARDDCLSLALSTELTVMVDSKVRMLAAQAVAQLLRSIPDREPLTPIQNVTTITELAVQPEITALQAQVSQVTPPEKPQLQLGEVVEVAYETIEVPPEQSIGEALYEVYKPQRLHILEAQAHPTTLCESVALASVRPPLIEYRPQLPRGIVEYGILSEAQLESIIYAGEAHSQCLSGFYRVENSFNSVNVCSSEDLEAVRFRRGWFLGDGTGAGKGRQVAGVILDNWCQGRKKAVWVSKSDKLIEDARRDWQALGGDATDVVPLSRYTLGKSIPLSQGILFTTYATLRGTAKAGKQSRLEQIVTWLGSEFEGVIAFDEAHAMGNASAEKGSRGLKAASQQGLAGLRLQNALPGARVLYVSATGATKVSNLAYASRLGLWQTGDFPFANRSEFISSIDAGGVAAMEVVCRDLKALGLYFARNLSFEGVEYAALEVPLTQEQIALYDAYAEAFQVIHSNLEEALQACNIVSSHGESLNRQAKMAARSAFESHKQRFFGHLLCSMKCPSLIRAIEEDLEAGQAVVIQVVSTNEELMKRRLAEISVEEWNDLNIDITPREYVMDYLVHAFPIHLYEEYTTEDGELRSQLVEDAEGNPVVCREALAQRDALVERLTGLPPLPGALDQLLHYFGHDQVAEVTGRSQRILCDPKTKRLFVSKRSGSANLDEAQAFMADEKRILIFSDAGGTGRSYHADLNCQNTRRRVHYLLEAGWRADNAIQGLGRSHRTNQASAPIFRPVVTDVRGERRFISTIARRLDSLGALTRGQRQTGGQGLFDPRDNLESVYAEAALRQLLTMLYDGQVDCCSLVQFEVATGLSLSNEDGQLRETLPGIPQFLNRLLALPIGMQNALFEVFELILEGKVEAAIASGTFEVGVETLRAEKFEVVNREVIYTHKSGGETVCIEIEETRKTEILSAEAALGLVTDQAGHLVVNDRSGHAAVQIPTSSTVSESGAVVSRLGLVKPTGRSKLSAEEFKRSHWRSASQEE